MNPPTLLLMLLILPRLAVTLPRTMGLSDCSSDIHIHSNYNITQYTLTGSDLMTARVVLMAVIHMVCSVSDSAEML